MIIFSLVCLSNISEIVSTFYGEFLNAHNISIANSYLIFETIIICFFYYNFLKNPYVRGAIIFTALSFVIVSTYLFVYDNTNMLNHISLTIESIIITILAIVTFSNLLINTAYSNILSAPIFWFNSAFLLFYSGNLLLHLFSRVLQTHAQNVLYELWGFHSVLNILLYILISIGFWKTRTSRI